MWLKFDIEIWKIKSYSQKTKNPLHKNGLIIGPELW